MEQEQDKTICSLDHELISVLGDLQSDQPCQNKQNICYSEVRSERNFAEASTETSYKSLYSKTVFSLNQIALSKHQFKDLIMNQNLKRILINFLREYELNRIFVMRFQMSSVKPRRLNASHHSAITGCSCFKFINFNKILHDTSSSKPNITNGEKKALRNLADDKSIITEQADNGSCVIVWEREDFSLQRCQI